MRSSIQRAKDALRTSSSSRAPAGQPHSSNTDDSTSQLISSSQATTGEHTADVTASNASSTAVKVPPRENSGTAWERLSSSLGVLEKSLGLFPPLKSAIGSLVGCLEVVKVAASNRVDYEELAHEFQLMVDALSQHVGIFESEKSNGSVANIVHRCMQGHIAEIKQHEEKGSIQRLRGATNDQEDVIKGYRQIERLFRQLQCDITMRTQDQVKKQLETTLLRGMLPVDDARYNSSYSMTIKRHGCTPQTREKVHQTLQEWATDPASEKIYWMSGMAGTGKTTIAYSFCEWLERTNRLGASFFCSRISSTCRSLNRIIPTLVYQLARYSPAFRSTLCVGLNDNPDAGSLNVGQQFEKLVYQPLIEAKAAFPDDVVMVIDALDECDDAFSVRLLLDVLLSSARSLPVKFFVLSRPEYAIRDRMITEDGAARLIMQLHDIEQSIVEEDIKKYLTEELKSMSPPPSPEQILMLAKRAGALFIYAATVARYIHPKVIPVDSSARLEAILNVPRATQDTTHKYKDLDRLYTTVLEAAFNEDLGEDEKGRIQHVLWAAVCAREPVVAATIGLLVGLSEPQVWSALQSLRSVLHVPENNGPVSVLHASFPDYMLDQSRSKELYCNESRSNEMLTHRCFAVMKDELRFNICNLTNSYLADYQVDHLDVRVGRSVSRTLSYACRHWSSHLLLSSALDDTRIILIDFLLNYLLFWMEVLSLSRCIGTGTSMMDQVKAWLMKMENSNNNDQRIVTEARNFITWFATHPCSQSTPHIYVSALPTFIKSSWIYRRYWKRIQGLPNITINTRDDAALATWSTDGPVLAIDISPDGNRIASGNIEGWIRIYDIRTGAIIAGPFQDHTSFVNSVAFSPDGIQLASCSRDGTIIIWDTQLCGIASGPLRGHRDGVLSVKFSLDGKRLVSGADDNTIIIWDVCTGTILVGPLQGHIAPVQSAVFSPNGNVIASVACQGDTTVRLWDSRTGNIIKQLDGHEAGIMSIAYSPNSKYLATGSNDNTVRVWDVHGGILAIPPLQGHKDQVLAVAFSSDGSYIVSGGGGRDRRIIIWDALTGSIVAGPFYGHADWIASVGFTPDNTRVVSCSMDCTIRIWDVRPQNDADDEASTHIPCTGPIAFSLDCSQFASSSPGGSLHVWDLRTGTTISPPFEEQLESEKIESIALSPTGTYLAAGFNNFTIQIWNVLTGNMATQTLEGHTESVRCMTFSPDSTLLCSGSDDATIIVWDVETGTMVDRPYAGHVDSVCSITFSPKGTHLASGSVDNSVRVWELSGNIPALIMIGHEGLVESIAFSPDGKYIISGSADGSIQMWEACSGDGVKTFFPARSNPVPKNLDSSLGNYPQNPIPVTWVSYSPDGTRIAAATSFGIYLFDVESTEIIFNVSARRHHGVKWVGFTPDGADMISVGTLSRDFEQFNNIRVWRAGACSTPLSSSRNAGGFYDVHDGRVLSEQGLVVWAPHDLIPFLGVNCESHHCALDFSPDGIINIGYKVPCIGERWAECFIQGDPAIHNQIAPKLRSGQIMSSPPPVDKPKKHRLGDSIQERIHRAKSWLNQGSSTGDPGRLTPPRITSRLFSLSRSPTPTPRAIPPSPEPQQEAPNSAAGSVNKTSILGAGANPIPDSSSNKPPNPALSGLVSSLRILETSAESFPPLKLAVGALIGCLDVVQRAESNRANYKALEKEFASMSDILNQHVSALDPGATTGSIGHISQSMKNHISEIKKQVERTGIGRLLDATQDQEDVMRRYREIDILFRQLQASNCDMSMRTHDQVKKQLEETRLQRMAPVGDAKYNSSYSTIIKRHRCTAQTREAIHQGLQDWATNSGSAKIYWMNGMAGTGKTTIAYSFCEWLGSTNQLGASFFCSRISSTCRSLSRIIPTISYQLARYSPAFQSSLCAILETDPDAGTLNVAQQFEKLVTTPLLEVKGAIPDNVVVVIDALDECDDSYSVRLLLDVLLKFAKDLPLKFFVASRPEPIIWDKMFSKGGTLRSIVHLHDIEKSIVEEDIKKYLTDALSSMSPPPSLNDIEVLAKRSRNLFIYAATVVRYIYPGDIHVDSSARLEAMLEAISTSGPVAENRYEDLDLLYTTVLSAVFHARLSAREKDNMRRVLWTVVCAKEPITAPTIASLTNLHEHQVRVPLQSLRSVVHVPENSALISTLHASFPEYMLDQSRSKGFWCDSSQSNEIMARRCFGVMQAELRFNMCNLQNSYLEDDQVQDLQSRISEFISPALSYACRYWASHLISAPATNDTCTELRHLLTDKLLFWMEVLSLSKCIGTGAPMMQQAQSWLQKLDQAPDEIQKQIADARNFATWFAANPCSRSTPHIYISALPLCAKSNWVYQHYSKRMQGLANVAIGQRDDAALAIWNTESTPFAIAVSPDGSRIASGHVNGSINIYDTQTGAIVAGPFKGHESGVLCVAFSPDGTHLASGSHDNTVIIWNTHSGSIVFGPFKGHTDSVWCVVFSPDGDRIVSGSADRSVIVWEASSGRIILGPLQGHTDHVYSVGYSSDASTIMSGSDDGTIRLWKAYDGTLIHELPSAGGELFQAALSPDGKQAVGCYKEGSIQIWDVASGTIAIPPFKMHKAYAYSVGFSQDGKYVISGGAGESSDIIVWDALTGSIVAGPLRGHSGTVDALVSLPDGTRIVSCSEDRTIRTWDIRKQGENDKKVDTRIASVGPISFSTDRSRFASISSNQSIHVRNLRTGDIILPQFEEQIEGRSIECVAYSSTGAYIAASSHDFTIQIWDAHTGVTISQSLQGHNSSIHCISFSLDDSHLCSGSDDMTIRIWETSTGTLVGRPYGGHTSAVRSVIYSPDGGHIVSGAADGAVHIWNPTTGNTIHTLIGHTGAVQSIAFSPDGNHIIIARSDGKVHKWDIGGNNVLEVPFENYGAAVSYACFSADSTHVLAGYGSSVGMVSIRTLKPVSEFSGPRDEEIFWVGYASNGVDIVTVSKKNEEKGGSGGEGGTSESSAIKPSRHANVIRVWRPSSFRIDQKATDSSTNSWSYKPDGRIVSPEGCILWVSPDLLPYMEVESESYYNPFVLSPDGIIDVGYKDLSIGNKWADCYIHKN
ncbi:WD40 repeat-like protein [Rhizoctonia solani]|uniref:WD40 repeat-like protein n=1 Tax=Rhizoctonia solani TaxID=456999 RepID=A0A8H7HD95_9AGAM|nr:WD40 repeat-like protein [Rhizoctonia solani]